MSTSESRFAERLIEITGAHHSKLAAHSGLSAPNAYVVADPPAAELPKIAEMSLPEIMNHPAFVKGFEDRVKERYAEIEAAVGDVELG